jgi:hypothetical protein
MLPRAYGARLAGIVAGVAVLAAALTAYIFLTPEQTTGERFRRAIEQREKLCAHGPVMLGDTSCDILQIKASDALDTQEGRFAHSLNVPGPYPPNVYQRGMSGDAYFRALCAAEAGDFIFKTVSNVPGIQQLRPRNIATDLVVMHLFALEDPGGYVRAEAADPEFIFVRPGRYRFLEIPITTTVNRSIHELQLKYRHPSYGIQPRAGSLFMRFERYDGSNMQSMVRTDAKERASRYGYTWRGISRPSDRELGIAGGELIVLDLETSEVLGVRREFAKTGNVRNRFTSIDWEFAAVCPILEGRSKADYSYEFLSRVLIPPSAD